MLDISRKIRITPVDRGTVRWMAKDFFDNDGPEAGKPTKSTDIWAFGMTVLVSKHLWLLNF